MSRAARLAVAVALAGAAAGAGALAPGRAAVGATVSHAPATPIHHFITEMQENHTFDNYFGTYPGADGTPPGTCVPVHPHVSPTPCVRPFHITGALSDPNHESNAAVATYDGGKMDGVVSAENNRHQDGALSLGYYDGSDVPFSWNAADRYVLFDHFFSSEMGPSDMNHVYWVAAGPANDAAGLYGLPPSGIQATTIFDELQSSGVSWKFYVENYDPSVNFWTKAALAPATASSQLLWCPLLDIQRFVDDPALASHIVNLNQYYKDLQDGTLPEVAYIIPSGNSEHPPTSLTAGQRFQHGLVTALMASSAWDSSAFMVSYDDWGGWYDHVPPPKRDAYGDGFRVPAYLISPYARRHYIDHTQLDFTSILNFIEQNWRVPPLTGLDATAGSIMGAFDFSKPPRPPEIIPLSRAAPTSAHRVPHQVLFASYGIATALVLALLAAAIWSRRPRPPRRVSRSIRRSR